MDFVILKVGNGQTNINLVFCVARPRLIPERRRRDAALIPSHPRTLVGERLMTAKKPIKNS